MKNFVYHNPTKILFGTNTLEKIGGETIQYGKKVLLLYGQNSAKNNGIYSTIIQSLENAGCDITEFSGITPNPKLSMVKDAIELFRKNHCEVICAVGGGSVIDTGKAVSCGAVVKHDVWQFFATKKSIKSSMPLVCIPTLAGSGSENNHGMVITNDSKSLKFGYGSRYLYPKVSLINPETTFTASSFQTACGCVDIISHLLEVYCNSAVKNASLQQRIIEGVILAVMENCEAALANPENYSARAQLMWASSLALGGITSSGLGRIGFPMHLIEHSISAVYDTAHGAGLAVVLPAWLLHETSTHPDRIAQLGRNLFQLNGANSKTTAQQTAIRFRNWFRDIGCPVTLSDLQIDENDLQKIATHTEHLAKIWRLRDYPPDRVLKILELGR